MMKVILGDENMSKINLCIFLLCSILTACVSSDSYFVRFWNGDVISDMTPEEEKNLIYAMRKLKIYQGEQLRKGEKQVLLH